MKQVDFAFGKTGLTIPLPDGPRYELIQCRSASPLVDASVALEQALDFPVAGPSLLQLAAGKKTASIAVCDITRPAPNQITLPPILQRLRQAGMPDDGITLLIATGLHRVATAEEVNIIVGAEIAAKYRVLNHDARESIHHRFLGTTHRKTPVYIDKRFLDSDLHITLGFIEQHLMLGFSGGRKLVVPGLAGEATIKTIHSPKFMREPLATEGSIEDNPLHAELLEIARMARHDFIVDVTLSRDRAISGVFAGSPPEAHAAGVDFLRRTSLELLSGPADAVITSAAGYPLDLTFYQSVKGITAAQHIVKPDGTILIVGECAEGIGSPEFSQKLKSLVSLSSYLDEIKDQAVMVDQWQLERLAMAGLKNRLIFYTPGVRKEQLGAFANDCFPDLSDAIEATFRDLPIGGKVALIPEGPYVFARVDAGQALA